MSSNANSHDVINDVVSAAARHPRVREVEVRMADGSTVKVALAAPEAPRTNVVSPTIRGKVSPASLAPETAAAPAPRPPAARPEKRAVKFTTPEERALLKDISWEHPLSFRDEIDRRFPNEPERWNSLKTMCRRYVNAFAMAKAGTPIDAIALGQIPLFDHGETRTYMRARIYSPVAPARRRRRRTRKEWATSERAIVAMLASVLSRNNRVPSRHDPLMSKAAICLGLNPNDHKLSVQVKKIMKGWTGGWAAAPQSLELAQMEKTDPKSFLEIANGAAQKHRADWLLDLYLDPTK